MKKTSAIARFLVSIGGTTMIEDEHDVDPCDFDDNGDPIVGEDNERDEWLSVFEFFDSDFKTITHALTEKFGPPSTVHFRGTDEQVNNWKIGPVLIVHGETRVETFQKFRRV